MAEQAVNTIYALGDQPDALMSSTLKEMTTRVFSPKSAAPTPAPEDDITADDSMPQDDSETPSTPAPKQRSTSTNSSLPDSSSFGNAFELSQLLFVAGHCAIKQLVHLELVERDTKRRKAEESKKPGAKVVGQDELDQVAGSIEDDIGDLIAVAKESELLYGPRSLLAVFGPMAASIVAQPKIYKVSLHPFLLLRIWY
jgi:condensin complex subunit 1